MESQIEVLPIVAPCGEKGRVLGFYAHSAAAGIFQRIKQILGADSSEIEV